MKRWRKMFGAPIAAAVLSCSLVANALGQDNVYQSEIEKAQNAQSAADIRQIRSDLEKSNRLDEGMREYLTRLDNDHKAVTPEVRNEIVNRLKFRQQLFQNSGDSGKPADTASDIKKNPLYTDPGAKESSNWMGKAFERLGDLFKQPPQTRSTRSTGDGSGLGAIGAVLIYIVIIALVGLLGYFVFLVASHFRWKVSLKRKAKALLEEDEPERTLDEWLQMADELTAQGKYREAVRCLYLACLLKFDEHGIARFERGETNWEHLARIKKSPKLPSQLDFEPATKQFDRIWYGYKIDGLADVGRFRAWYSEITEMLERSKAA